jgi:hypothetical protein
MQSFRQIWAIAHMEFRFAFRRSAPVVTTIMIGLLVSAGILVSQIPVIRTWSGLLIMTPEQTAKWIALGFTIQEVPHFVRDFIGDIFVYGSSMAWMLMFLSLLLLPAATISVIPADRIFGISELLRSTPLTGARYLAGKILGALLAVLLVAVIMFVLFFAVTEIILVASLHFFLSWSASLYFIKLSLLGGLPLLACGTTIGVLVGVLFRSRRAAVFPGLIIGLLSIYFWMTTFRSPVRTITFPPMDKIEYFLLQNYTSPAQEQVIVHYGVKMDLLGIVSPIGLSQVIPVYLIILLVLGVLAILARLWLQWKENF